MNLIARIALPLVACLLIAQPSVMAAQQEDDDPRQVWTYQTKAGARKIVDEGNGKWLLHFPNGATADLIEQDRTGEYIQLQNPQNKNVQRLFADRGLIKKPEVGEFRKFADGKWSKADSDTEPNAAERGSDRFVESGYQIHVVYFVPRDRKPKPQYEQKIRVIVELMQEIMTDDLRAKNHETEGPQFVTRDGKIAVHLLNGERTARDYNHGEFKSAKHAQAVFDEVDRRFASTRQNMVLVFAETHDPGPAPRLWPGHIAMAAARPPKGGIGLFSAWLLRDEFCSTDPDELRKIFFDETPVQGRRALGSRVPNSPRADFVEDGIGGALHELAHMFGCTHHGWGDKTNIMSQGFRDLRWNVGIQSNKTKQASFSKENAWMLMTSRYLNAEVDKEDNRPPEVNLRMSRRGANITATVDARDDKQLQLVSLVEVTAKQGRQIVDSKKLRGTQQMVQFKFNAKKLSSPNPSLQVILVDGGGNHAKVVKKFIEK